MPRKIRELRADLRRAGYVLSRTKGNHSTWKHSKKPVSATVSGNDGDDAKPYQEKQVGDAIQKAQR